MVIFFIGYIALFTTLSSLYYTKEYNRVASKNLLKNRLKQAECKRLTNKDCSKIKLIKDVNVDNVYKDIFFAFIFSFIVFGIFAYFLAKASLKPVRESINLMDNFINSIIHDINTPLSVIKLNTSSINKKLIDEKLKIKSHRILDSITKIEDLQEQLLYSIRSHTMSLKNENFDLDTLIRDSLKIFNSNLYNIQVIYNGEKTKINADKKAIYRVLQNIVSNAIKYSHNDVYITLKDKILSIKDSGDGIKDPELIFEKYYSDNKEKNSLGLGLFIVSTICNRYNIDIKVNSNENGSEFLLDLSTL